MQQTGSTTPPAGTPCRPHDEHRAHRAGRVKASNLFRRRYRKIRRRLRRSDQVADSLAEERGFEPSVPPKAIQTEPLFRTVHDAPLAAPSADRLDLVGMDLHAEGN